MYKYFIVIIVILSSFLSATASELPEIIVDEEHIGFSRSDDSEPPPYIIPPAKGIVVLIESYKIDVPKEYNVKGPNAIHLMMGENEKYKVSWKGKNHRYELTSSTLIPIMGSVAFKGFKSNDTAIVAIGYDHTGITPGKENVLSAMWLGMIKVK